MELKNKQSVIKKYDLSMASVKVIEEMIIDTNTTWEDVKSWKDLSVFDGYTVDELAKQQVEEYGDEDFTIEDAIAEINDPDWYWVGESGIIQWWL